MNTKRLLLITCIILLFSGCAHQAPSLRKETDLGGGIVYGKEHAFIIIAPQGWVLDNHSGINQGLYAVFYPVGSNWKDSDVVMYVNTAYVADGVALEDFIESDIQRFKADYGPSLVVQKGDSIYTKKGKIAEVRTYSGDKWGNYESVAYMQEKRVMILIVLSARNESLYRQTLPVFQSLIQSYYFITDNVNIKQ